MATDLCTSRTPTVEYQRCPRRRFWGYEYDHGQGGPRGIQPARRSVALAVGGAFHVGAAVLLEGKDEDYAVSCALASFVLEADAGLDLEMGELLGQTPLDTGIPTPADEWALPVEQAAVLRQANQQDNAAAAYAAYLRAEQACLLEGMVRAWARRGLPRLLEEWEVLEVEREGRWVLADVSEDMGSDFPKPATLWFQSRPDALLRSRATGELALQSFKTTGAWDARKGKDAERDMQGLSEVVEVERRLGEWWAAIHANTSREVGTPMPQHYPETTSSMFQYLNALPAPPRITTIRYEYVLKGKRDWSGADNASRLAKQTAERFGFNVGVQQSKLCYLWAKQGMTAADRELAHSFAWQDVEGKGRKLYYKDWQQAPVWETIGGVKAWVDLLDRGAVQPEAERDVLAEAMLPPVSVYRTDDSLRDWLEQVEAQEVQVAHAAAEVNAAGDEAERRSLLNRHFVQYKHSCSYPGECQFARICYGGAEVGRDPIGSGLYTVRVANHSEQGETA